MALLWIEGFEWIGTSVGSAPSPANVMTRKYSNVNWESAMQVQTGRLGGYCLKFNGAGPWLQPPNLTTDSTMVLGLAYKFGNVNANVAFLSFYDGTTQGMNLSMAGGGEISVRRGSTVLKTTSGLGLLNNQWYYFEFKVVCGASGSYELRIDGVNKCSDSGVNTKAGSHDYHTTFALGEGAIQSTNANIDDLYCLDGTGSANHDFLGNQKVIAISPSGDVTTDFTPSAAGTHHTLVDENPINDDADYVEDSATDHTDLWDYADPAGVGVVAGIQINTFARETDATSFSLKTVIQSGVTEDTDAGQAVGGTTYRNLRRISEKDPHTDAAWTSDAIHAAQFGVRVG